MFTHFLEQNTSACVDSCQWKELTVAWASPEGVQWNRQHQETGGNMGRALMGEVSGEYLQVPQTEETSI